MNNIDTARENIKKQFLADDRAWVVAFSGGKDSTLLLHLTMEVVIEFKKQNIPTKKVFIISSDTNVEMPIMEAYHFNKMKQLKEFVEKEELNVEVKLVTPELKDDFFVCLLGRRYPSSNLNFQWCIQRLKINPSVKYLQNATNEYSEKIDFENGVGYKAEVITGRNKSDIKGVQGDYTDMIAVMVSNTHDCKIEDVNTLEKYLEKHCVRGFDYLEKSLNEKSSIFLWLKNEFKL